MSNNNITSYIITRYSNNALTTKSSRISSILQDSVTFTTPRVTRRTSTIQAMFQLQRRTNLISTSRNKQRFILSVSVNGSSNIISTVHFELLICANINWRAGDSSKVGSITDNCNFVIVSSRIRKRPPVKIIVVMLDNHASCDRAI